MKRLRVLAVVGELIAGVTAATASATGPQVRPLLDRAVADGGVPGILSEVRDGRWRWFGTAGVADLTAGGERSRRDRFHIGSATKTFTATVALQLVAERRLRLDDTVERWLPGLVQGNGNDGGQITVRQLLNHTSGLFDYLRDQEAVNQHEVPTPEQLVRVAMAHPPLFAPGASWAYGNTNYVLVGMIVERAGHLPLADQIDRRITQPLGLTGTYLPRGGDRAINGPHSRHYTKLYSPDPNAPVHDVTELNSSPFWAGGGMISTAGDLNRFFGALLGGRLLPPAQQREMFTDLVPTPQDWVPNTEYGLGITSLDLKCHPGGGPKVWGMGGAILGSWSYTYGTRDGGHLVTTNVNGDWAHGPWRTPIDIFTDVLEAEFCPRQPAAP
jgi:D-alanyl-D-alanine carboxypeptidase